MNRTRQERLKEFYNQWKSELTRIIEEKGIPPKKEIFERMAWELSRISYKFLYIDVSYRRKAIDFNMTLPSKVFISCCIYESTWDETKDLCYFAIDQNHETISIDKMDLTEFVDKVVSVLEELKKKNGEKENS